MCINIKLKIKPENKNIRLYICLVYYCFTNFISNDLFEKSAKKENEKFNSFTNAEYIYICIICTYNTSTES